MAMFTRVKSSSNFSDKIKKIDLAATGNRDNERLKDHGPYIISDIVWGEIGREPKNKKFAKGLWLISKLSNKAGDEIRVRVNEDFLKETNIEMEMGVTVDSFIGKLFMVKATSSSPIDLNAGKAQIIDSQGTRKMRGITEMPVKNKVASCQPLSIAAANGICPRNISERLKYILGS